MSTVQEGPGTAGSRIVRTDYPNQTGLEAGTTLQQDEPSLVEDPW